MPIPTPNNSENRQDFLDRCMADSTMNEDYPDSDQRFAVCSESWDTNKEPSDMEKKKFQSFNIDIKKVDDESREITAVGSKQVKDRDNDIVSIDGMDIKNYRKNPVFLWSHRGSETPENVLGNATKVTKKDKELVFNLKFLDSDINPRADMVYKMYKSGVLKSFSIGFAPDWNTASFNEKRGGYDFPKTELLEISAVPVPANPHALIQTNEFKEMVENGLVDEAEVKDFEIFLKENYKEPEEKVTKEEKQEETQEEVEPDPLLNTIEELKKRIEDLEKRIEAPVVEPEIHIVDQALAEIFDASGDEPIDATEDEEKADDLNSIFTELE